MAGVVEKCRFLAGMLKGDHAHTGPFHVTVDLTRRCNLRCLGCRYQSPEVGFTSPADSDVKDISFELVDRMCRDLKQMGTRDIILTGEGEPCFHPRFKDIVRLVKDSGFYVTLITNGTLLDPENAEMLVDAGLDCLKVSLWASSEEDHRLNYPGLEPSHLAKVAEGIRLVATTKAERDSRLPQIYLHHVINRHNFQDLDRIVDFAVDAGVEEIGFAPFKVWEGVHSECLLSPSEAEQLMSGLTRVRKRLAKLPLKHNITDALLRFRIGQKVWEKLPCYIGWFHARVKLDGTVLPCDPCDSPVGDLKEQRFPEIWNSPAYRAFRRQTRYRTRLAVIADSCDCGFCCHLAHNARIHRLFRWFAPLSRVLGT